MCAMRPVTRCSVLLWHLVLVLVLCCLCGDGRIECKVLDAQEQWSEVSVGWVAKRTQSFGVDVDVEL